MKKALTLILAAGLLIAALAACGSKTTPKDYDLAAMAADLKDNGGYSDIISPVVKDVAAKLYNVDAAGIADCQVYCATKATTEEPGLFKCTDEKAAAALYEAAKARVESQRSIYSSYAPAEMPKLDDSIVKQDGNYVFYIVTADSAKAHAVLDKYMK